MALPTSRSSAAPDAKMWAFAVLLLLLVVQAMAQVPDANDVSCLAGLKQGFKNSAQLDSWNNSLLANPCYNQTLTSLLGVICNSNRVISISLAGKGLGGVISPAITHCFNLNSLDLSGNDLTGPIPQQMGQLALLVKLNLSKNSLTGTIPDTITNCSFLNLLDLHDNRLSGSIPFSLGSMSRLTTFDVSDNDLSGRIPYNLANSSTGPRFNASSFRGNKGLYGYPLSESEHKSHGLSVVAIVAVGLGSGLLSLVISFTAVCLWLRLSEQRMAAEEGKISELMPE